METYRLQGVHNRKYEKSFRPIYLLVGLSFVSKDRGLEGDNGSYGLEERFFHLLGSVVLFPRRRESALAFFSRIRIGCSRCSGRTEIGHEQSGKMLSVG